MLAGTCRFDGGIERQQVGLLSKVVNYFDDLADVVSTLSQHANDFSGRADRRVDLVQPFCCFVHRGDAAVYLFTGPVRNVEENLCRVGDALNGRNHLVN